MKKSLRYSRRHRRSSVLRQWSIMFTMAERRITRIELMRLYGVTYKTITREINVIESLGFVVMKSYIQGDKGGHLLEYSFPTKTRSLLLELKASIKFDQAEFLSCEHERRQRGCGACDHELNILKKHERLTPKLRNQIRAHTQ